MSPRILIAVVIALVAGLLLGRTGPQGDLRRANEQIQKLRDELAQNSRKGGGASLSGMKTMFNVSQDDLDAGAKARRAREATLQESAAATNTTAKVVSTNLEAVTTERPPPDRAAVSNQIQKMKEAWSIRTDIARSNFVARTKLDAKQQMDFAVLLEAMNVRLGTSIDKWAAVIREKGEMTPEIGMRMMTEMGNAMVLTYDEFDRVMPPGWREGDGNKLEMVDFVDPEVLTPLQDLEGIIQQSQSQRDPNRPRPRGPGSRLFR